MHRSRRCPIRDVPVRGHEAAQGRLGEYEASAGIVEDVAHRLGGELMFDGYRYDAGAHRAQHECDEFQAVERQYADAIAALEARALQAPRATALQAASSSR